MWEATVLLTVRSLVESQSLLWFSAFKLGCFSQHLVQRHFDEIRSYPRISDLESQFKSNLQTYLMKTWMKHGKEAEQTFPTDGSNDIALGGTPAAKK